MGCLLLQILLSNAHATHSFIPLFFNSFIQLYIYSAVLNYGFWKAPKNVLLTS